MKTRTHAIAIAIVTLLIGVSQSSFAQDHTGGGGSIVHLPDGRTVLGDPFIVDQKAIIRITPEFRSYIEAARSILSRYSFCTGAGKYLDQMLIRGDGIHMVDRFPDDVTCKFEAMYEVNGTKELVACTVGPQTYILKDKFALLDLENQAGVLIHEGLHASLNIYSPQNDYYYRRPKVTEITDIETRISRVTAGTLLTLRKLREQVKGDRTPLSGEEITAIQLMMSSLVDLDEQCDKVVPATVSAHGGLISTHFGADPLVDRTAVKHRQVDPTAMIGIGAYIRGHDLRGQNTHLFKVNPNATILMSSITSKSIMIGENARIIDTTLSAPVIRLDASTQLEHSSINSRKNILIGNEASLKNVFLYQWGNFDNHRGSNVTIREKAILDGIAMTPPPARNCHHKFLGSKDQVYYDLVFGKSSLVKGVFLEEMIIPEFTCTDKKPMTIIFDDGAQVDRSVTPFHRCLTSRKDTARDVVIRQDSDLEAQFCN